MVNARLRKMLQHAIRVSEKQVIEDYKKFEAALVEAGYNREAFTISLIIHGERGHLGMLGRIKKGWSK